MQAKTCCVTGHRDIPQEQLAHVESALRDEVRRAIEDGYTRFISGFASGTDLIFAAVVVEQKRQHPEISLEAALPHADRINTPDARFHELLRACNVVNVTCEKYAPYCFDRRNRYMVDKSQCVLAVYDGRSKGGTYKTMRYAQKCGKEIHVVSVQTEASGD